MLVHSCRWAAYSVVRPNLRRAAAPADSGLAMVRRGQAACGGDSTFLRRIGSRWEALFVAYRGDAKNAVRALATSAGSVMVRAHLPRGTPWATAVGPRKCTACSTVRLNTP